MPATTPALRVQLDCPTAWHEPVVASLAAAGVVVDPLAAVGLSVGPGRTVSATVDDWSVSSLPHLLVGTWPYAVEVGPWVAPGIGPCARCVAASVLDDGSTTAPTVVPRALMSVASGMAARDLASWARAETPCTWLTSWRVDHAPLPRERRWQRHPYCGCAWFDTA